MTDYTSGSTSSNDVDVLEISSLNIPPLHNDDTDTKQKVEVVAKKNITDGVEQSSSRQGGDTTSSPLHYSRPGSTIISSAEVENLASSPPPSLNATLILSSSNHRRNSSASTSRRGIRAINHMESISETGQNVVARINMDDAATSAASYSTPRRRIIRSSMEGAGENQSTRSEGGSGTRFRQSIEDNSDDENLERRRLSSSGSSLVASLDAGMSTLRRWIHARTPSFGAGETSAPGSSTNSVSSMTTMRLGEEDVFALSHTGRRVNTTASTSSSDPNVFDPNSSRGFLYYHPLEVQVRNDVDVDHSTIYGSDDESGTHSRILHPLISSEQTDSNLSVDDNRGQQPRQRAFSEPSRARIADFISSVYGSRAIDINSTTSPTETVSPGRRIREAMIRHRRSSSMQSAGTTSPMIVEEETDATDNIAPRRIQLISSLDAEDGAIQLDVSDFEPLDAILPPESVSSNSTLEAEHTTFDDVVNNIDDGDDPNLRLPSQSDPESEARIRWIRINRRFKCMVTSVAIIFSLLLFCILISWVMLIATYVLSHNRICDVPLKEYVWLVSFQLALDVFRADIMKWLCRWRSDSQRRVPPRVILYNAAYLVYAMFVLRLGAKSVYVSESTCSSTAPELFYASLVFVCLSLLAWATIFLGYLIPFVFVAILLTRNGYFPNGDITSSRGVMGGRRTRIGTGRISGMVGGMYFA